MTRLGLYNSSEMVLQSALEEDVDVRDVETSETSTFSRVSI